MIGSSLDPARYRDPRFVAERLYRMTSGRRRIELRAEHVDVVSGRRRANSSSASRQTAASVVAEVRSGRPQPPPPGVSIRSTSPRSRWTVHLSGRRSAARLVAAGEQPVLPHRARLRRRRDPSGWVTRRSVMSDTSVARAPRARARCRRRPRAARPAAPPPQPVAQDPQRERALQRLDRGVERVRHRGVDAAHAGAPTGGRPGRRRPSRSRPEAVARPSPPRRTLFMVPWLGRADPVGQRLGRARRGTRRPPAGSPPRCRRPPPPAGPRRTTVPGGAITCTGRREPPLAGSVGSVTARSAKATALTVTASTAFTLPGAARRCR